MERRAISDESRGRARARSSANSTTMSKRKPPGPAWLMIEAPLVAIVDRSVESSHETTAKGWLHG